MDHTDMDVDDHADVFICTDVHHPFYIWIVSTTILIAKNKERKRGREPVQPAIRS